MDKVPVIGKPRKKRYITLDGQPYTTCDIFHTRTIGDETCCSCQYHIKVNEKTRTVLCNCGEKKK